ncbi:MAG: hypothetical protein KC431_09285, partial [Myxococcales bacterium]|nr:hypothetical protein [Myxococcales bacterium]
MLRGSPRKASFIVVLAASIATSACYGGRDDNGQDEGALAEEVEIAGTLALTSTCVALEPGERPAAISPGGDLWLATGTGPASSYRVFSIDGSVRFVDLEHATDRLQAWDESHVHYLADDQMWLSEIDEQLTEPLYWPADLPAPSDFCGDPTIDGDGFVVAGTSLLQRDAGLWWRWLAPGGGDFGPVSLLGRSYGACVDRNGDLWLADGAGEVWRIGANEARSVSALAGAQALVFDESFGAAALIDGALVHGS